VVRRQPHADGWENIEIFSRKGFKRGIQRGAGPLTSVKIKWLFPVALIGLFGVVFRFYYLPLESILEILKTLRTDPVIVILRCISLLNGAGASLQTELDPAKSAMVVIPIGILFVLALPPVDKGDPFEVLLLTRQAPVAFFFHLVLTEQLINGIPVCSYF
jgi:hypothetical protein